MAKKESSKATWIIIIITIFVLFVISLFVAVFVALMLGSENVLLGNVALIPIDGIIVSSSQDSLFGGGMVASVDVIDWIKKADANPGIQAIIFEINSPGGSAVPSDEISQAIKSVNKTTVALIKDVGASGAYWIASAADKIVANRMSITGSIGVTSSYLEFSGLLDDYNVTYERLVTGQYKDMGTPFRKLEEEERQILQKKLDKIHDIFVKEVATNRNLDEEVVRGLSNGMFYLGIEAKELGLIDELGGIEEVKEIIKQETGLTELRIIKLKKKPSLIESLSQIMSKNFFSLAQSPKIELR